ncbi:endonuclease domain-containing protein [Sphingosinicella sp. BN140058]|nr:endonuclease domain-containing protein [Sphingosinicella sp. BN140058]
MGRARTLRKEMSLPEVLLWRELRKRPAGLKFRRQHPAGPFVLDFACLSSRVAIEIDGAAHDPMSAQFRDEGRDEWLANQGFSTLRIAARDVLSNLEGVLQLVISQCAAGQPLHHAAPRRGPPPRTGEV